MTSPALPVFVQAAEVAFVNTTLGLAPWDHWGGANRVAGLAIRLSQGIVLGKGPIVAEAFAGLWAMLRVQNGACAVWSPDHSRAYIMMQPVGCSLWRTISGVQSVT